MSRADKRTNPKYKATEKRRYERKKEGIQKAARSYYLKNKDALKERAIKWRARNPASYLLSAAKSRAKSSGMEFNIAIDDIEIPRFCPVLGIELVHRGGRTNSPSIDRIDNSKGYVKGNVIVISVRANLIKRDATLLELQRIADFYTRIAASNMLTASEQLL